MANTDLENRALSKIAYWDLGTTAEFYQIAGEKAQLGGEFGILSADQRDNQRDKLRDLGIDVDEGGNAQDWRLVSVYDTNDENGFYACVIETSPGHATVVFRGSETFREGKNSLDDWGRADIGLLNRAETEQQAEVERFLQDSKTRSVLMQYDHISMTGHSLGGNLAEHAGIVCADDGDLFGRIDSITSLDGPGFSAEYLEQHRGQIEDMADKIHHYRWSFVGGLLYDLPGASYHYVQADREKYDSEGHSMPFELGKHSLEYTSVGAEGSFVINKNGYAELERDVRGFSEIYDVFLKTYDNPLIRLNPLLNPFPYAKGLWLLSKVLTVAGTGASATAAYLGSRDQRAASDEADDFKDIYLDEERFEELAVVCANLIERLKEVSLALQDIDEGATETVGIPANIRDDGRIQRELSRVNKVINAFKKLRKGVKKSKTSVDRSIETLGGTQTYLSKTAEDFTQVEMLAENLMRDWQGLVAHMRN